MGQTHHECPGAAVGSEPEPRRGSAGAVHPIIISTSTFDIINDIAVTSISISAVHAHNLSSFLCTSIRSSPIVYSIFARFPSFWCVSAPAPNPTPTVLHYRPYRPRCRPRPRLCIDVLALALVPDCTGISLVHALTPFRHEPSIVDHHPAYKANNILPPSVSHSLFPSFPQTSMEGRVRKCFNFLYMIKVAISLTYRVFASPFFFTFLWCLELQSQGIW